MESWYMEEQTLKNRAYASGKNSSSILKAAMLLSPVFFSLFIPSLFFAAGGKIEWWILPVSILLGYSTCYFAAVYFFGKNWLAQYTRCALISFILILLSIVVAGFFYDTSVDGLVYHQEAVYQLRNGWNPAHVVLKDTVSQAMWINHYPKGAEIPQAVVYSFTGRIETGKATNLMLLAASFYLVRAALLSVFRLSRWKTNMVSLLIVFNPVTINQVFTYYVDGQIACLLLCLIASSILLYFDSNRHQFYLFGTTLIILSNIKFTSLVFAVLFVLAFLVLLIIYRQRILFKQVLVVSIVAGILAVGLTGYNPYIRNTVSHHHPFYPLMGNSSIDIIKESYPFGFAEKGRFEKFFISFFAHTDNEGSWVWEERSPTLKIPFTLNKVDIENSRTEDTRVGGFGPLFSGIFIASMLIYFWAAFRGRDKILFNSCLLITAFILASVFIIPESWWARYVPQLWFVPFILLLSTVNFNQRFLKLARNAVFLLIAFNICFSLLSVPYRVLTTLQLKYQLAQLKATGETVTVNWGNARSNRIRFEEKDIPFREVAKMGDSTGTEITGSDSRFWVTTLPVVKMPALLKMWRNYKPLEK